MEVLKSRIKKENVNIYYLTDTHTGAENQRTEDLKKFVDIIDKDPDAVVIGGGDYIEAIVMSDPRFSPGELQNKYKLKDLKDLPRIQMQEFYSIIKPIEDKFIGMLVGNHEEQYIKRNHFNVYDYLVSELMHKTELKMGQNGFIQLRIGKNTVRTITIYCTHGEGISTSPKDGTVMESFIDLCADKDADIFFGGHVHRLMETSKNIIGLDSNGNLRMFRKLFIIGGAWLSKYYIGTSGYFESKKGNETQSGFIRVNASTKNHNHILKLTTHKFDL